jgi:hypothetical protein
MMVPIIHSSGVNRACGVDIRPVRVCRTKVTRFYETSTKIDEEGRSVIKRLIRIK